MVDHWHPLLPDLDAVLRERLSAIRLRWLTLALFDDEPPRGQTLLVHVGVRWFWRRRRAHQLVREALHDFGIRRVGARGARVVVF